jgi:hypothetical protein
MKASCLFGNIGQTRALKADLTTALLKIEKLSSFLYIVRFIKTLDLQHKMLI